MKMQNRKREFCQHFKKPVTEHDEGHTPHRQNRRIQLRWDLRKSCQRHHFAFWVLETNIVRSFVLEIHFSVPLSDLDGHLS